LGKGFRIGKEMKGSTDEGGKARKVPEVHLHAHPKHDEVVVDLGKQVIKVWDASPLGQRPCRSIDDRRFRHHLSRELDMCIETESSPSVKRMMVERVVSARSASLRPIMMAGVMYVEPLGASISSIDSMFWMASYAGQGPYT